MHSSQEDLEAWKYQARAATVASRVAVVPKRDVYVQALVFRLWKKTLTISTELALQKWNSE